MTEINVTPSEHPWLIAITDIGDNASLIAILVAAAIYLISCKSHRAIDFLIVAYLISAAITVIGKIVIPECYWFFPRLGIDVPSGHASDSTAVLGGCAVLMCTQLKPIHRILPVIIFTSIVVAISYSRVALGVHTMGEIIFGVLIGLIGIGTSYALLLLKKPVEQFEVYPLLAWGVGAAVAMHGVHMPTEDMIHALAASLKEHIPFC